MHNNACLALICLLLLTLGLCRASLVSNVHSQTTVKVDSQVSSSINNAEEFLRRVSGDAVVVHIDVDWSFDAVLARTNIRRMLETIHESNELQQVDYLRVDATEQDTLWLEQWLREVGCNPYFVSNGTGTMIWLRSGRVVNIIAHPAKMPTRELIALANQELSEPKPN